MNGLAISFLIDDELLQRVVAFNDKVHDIDELEGVSFLMNHFIRLGITSAEAERDNYTQELF